MVTINKLKEIGFFDKTGGWGGSQGSEQFYQLKKGKIDLTIQTYDSDSCWHLENNFDVIFKNLEDINDYCLKNFGELVFNL